MRPSSTCAPPTAPAQGEQRGSRATQSATAKGQYSKVCVCEGGGRFEKSRAPHFLAAPSCVPTRHFVKINCCYYFLVEAPQSGLGGCYLPRVAPVHRLDEPREEGGPLGHPVPRAEEQLAVPLGQGPQRARLLDDLEPQGLLVVGGHRGGQARLLGLEREPVPVVVVAGPLAHHGQLVGVEGEVHHARVPLGVGAHGPRLEAQELRVLLPLGDVLVPPLLHQL